MLYNFVNQELVLSGKIYLLNVVVSLRKINSSTKENCLSHYSSCSYSVDKSA